MFKEARLLRYKEGPGGNPESKQPAPEAGNESLVQDPHADVPGQSGARLNRAENDLARARQRTGQENNADKRSVQIESLNSEKLQRLIDQQNRIAPALSANGFDAAAVMTAVDSLYGTPEELAKNPEKLQAQQAHMRELEKAAGAGKEWGVINDYGKTDGAGNVFIYKIEGQNLVAYSPLGGGNYQVMDLQTGTWKITKPPKGVDAKMYSEVTKGLSKNQLNVFRANTHMEAGVIYGYDGATLSSAAKDKRSWTGLNGNIYTLFDYKEEDAVIPKKKSEIQEALAQIKVRIAKGVEQYMKIAGNGSGPEGNVAKRQLKRLNVLVKNNLAKEGGKEFSQWLQKRYKANGGVTFKYLNSKTGRKEAHAVVFDGEKLVVTTKGERAPTSIIKPDQNSQKPPLKQSMPQDALKKPAPTVTPPEPPQDPPSTSDAPRASGKPDMPSTPSDAVPPPRSTPAIPRPSTDTNANPVAPPSIDNGPSDNQDAMPDKPTTPEPAVPEPTPSPSSIQRAPAPQDQPDTPSSSVGPAPRSNSDAPDPSANNLAETPEQKEEAEIKERVGQCMEKYESLMAMGKEEFSANIEGLTRRYEAEGNLFVVMLAMDAFDPDNNINPRNAIERFVRSGTAFAKKVDGFKKEVQDASPGEQRQLIEGKLSQFKYLFEQTSHMQGFDFDNLTSRMNTDQLLLLYQVCVLEEHVRNQNIEYGGDTFCDVLSSVRTGDCNAVASYYAGLISFAGSEELSNADGYLNVTGHSQVVFDFGKDIRGKSIRISKNSSYVDRSQWEDNGGKQPHANPMNHNFYDFEHDVAEQGISPEQGINTTTELVVGNFNEHGKKGKLARWSVDELRARKDFYEGMLDKNPHDAMLLSNYASIVNELISRGDDGNGMPESEKLNHIRDLSDRLNGAIDASYYSALDIENITADLRTNDALKNDPAFAEKINALVQKSIDAVLNDKSSFEKFMDFPGDQLERDDLTKANRQDYSRQMRNRISVAVSLYNMCVNLDHADVLDDVPKAQSMIEYAGDILSELREHRDELEEDGKYIPKT